MVNTSAKYREAYNKGEEIVPDYIYDEMFEQYDAELNDAGQGELMNHLHFMGSLPTHFLSIPDITWETLSKLGVAKSDKYTVSYKIDGVPGSCWYNTKTGKCDRILSRGKRLEGFVMSDLFKSVIPDIDPAKLPATDEDYVDVRGEFVIAYSDFEEINSKLDKKFANPRSMVSASVNALKPNKLIMSKMKFQAHGIWAGDKSFEHFEVLDQLFDNQYVAPHTYCNFDNLVDTIKNWYSICFNGNNPIPCDGIVCQHSITDANDGHCNLDRIALKQLDENKFSAFTTIKKIDWNVNVKGEYVPLIWFDEVEINGSKVQKCAGHCYDFIVRMNVSVGATAQILLRGGVIPYLHKVTNPGNGDICMPADAETPQDGDIHLYIKNREENSMTAKMIKGGVMLGLDGFGVTFWTNLSKVYNNIFEVIDEARNRVLCGNLVCNDILPNTDNGNEMADFFVNFMQNISYRDLMLVLRINGIGPKTVDDVVNHIIYNKPIKANKYVSEFLKNTDLIDKIKKYGNGTMTTVETTEKHVANGPKTILSKKPTNGMKKADWIAKYIPENEIVDSIAEAELLICPAGETSSKIEYAKKHNITIKYYNDFE